MCRIIAKLPLTSAHSIVEIRHTQACALYGVRYGTLFTVRTVVL